MNENSFYILILGALGVVGLVAGLAQLFSRTARKAPYNYTDEKEILALNMDAHGQLYPNLRAIFQALNPMKQKNVDADSYDKEARTIILRLEECSSAQDVFAMMDEEFYRWHGTSPMFHEFYDRITEAAEQIWAQYRAN